MRNRDDLLEAVLPAALVALTVDEVLARRDELVRTYLAMYAMPPAAGPRFGAMLAEHATRAGFRFCVAMAEDDGLCTGFGYGFTGQPGQAWRASLAAAMSDELTEAWLRDYFEFAEFGVIPIYRQRGVGGRLHDAVFRGLPHRRAVLTVRQENAIARAFYERRGWLALHDDFYAPSGRGPYVIMGHELPSIQ
jgi:ribosomal protein S18 acetylase RimI-like enzyme